MRSAFSLDCVLWKSKALDWRDVDLVGGFIHVGAKISKTRSRRLVPILDCLRLWLQPIAKTSGPIIGVNLRKRHEATRERAGINEWQENCMRHSFVSYRLAATGNAAQTALESGHDQAVLFKHYRELVRPTQAQRYWSNHARFRGCRKDCRDRRGVNFFPARIFSLTVCLAWFA